MQNYWSEAAFSRFEFFAGMATSGSVGSQCGERECPEDEDLLFSKEVSLMEGSDSKREKRAEDGEGFSFRGVELDEGIWGALHDCLLEKIIARLPFKSLFRAASLSKSWRQRLRSDSFQSEVLRSSAGSWKGYAPLYVNQKMELVGYESGSGQWQVLPNHSYLHQDVVEGCRLKAVAGSLLCWTSMVTSDVYNVIVTNPLTRSWRQLPPCPAMQSPQRMDIVCDGTEAYKVMLTTESPNICVQIFDSTNGAWTLNTYDTDTLALELGCTAYVDGVLYLLVGTTWPRRIGYKLISLDVKEKRWTEIPLKVTDGDDQSDQQMMRYGIRSLEIIFCGSNAMLVAEKDWLRDVELSVYELDLERGVAVEVSRAPNKMADLLYYSDLVAYDNDGCGAAGHGDCLYIGRQDRFWSGCYSTILYNLETREWQWVKPARTDMLKLSISWRSLPMPIVAYQPGLNPFLEV